MPDALGQKPDSMAVRAGNFEIARMIIEAVKAKKAALASGWNTVHIVKVLVVVFSCASLYRKIACAQSPPYQSTPTSLHRAASRQKYCIEPPTNSGGGVNPNRWPGQISSPMCIRICHMHQRGFLDVLLDCDSLRHSVLRGGV